MRSNFRTTSFSLLFLIGLKCVFGANAAAAVELPDPSGDMIIGQILQVFLALAVTLATIWGLSKIAMKKRWNKGFEKQRIKILDTLALGTRDRIMLIEVDNQNILVASTPGQIRSLHCFEKRQEDSNEKTSFKTALNTAMPDNGALEPSL